MSSITKNRVPLAVTTQLEIDYKEGVEVAARSLSYRNIVGIESTSSSAKQVVFFGDRGRLRVFKDERQPQGFNEYSMIMSLKKWEGTVTVPRDVLDDDQSGGILRTKVKNFASMIESSKEEYTWTALRLGSSSKGFDKANLFDINHAYVDTNGATVGATALGGPGLQSNMNLGGSLLDANTLQVVQQHFSGIKSDKNKPLGMRLTHVAVRRGSANAKTARELANSQYTVEASSVKGQMTENVFKGAFDIVETDYALGVTEWIAMDLSQADMRPMMVLTHSVSPGFDNMEYTQLLEDAETGFWRDELAFGVKGRFGWNVGDWRTVYLQGLTTYTVPTLSDLENGSPLQSNY